MPDEVDLTLVTLTFDAADPDRLLGVLAKYVVMSRGHRVVATSILLRRQPSRDASW